MGASFLKVFNVAERMNNAWLIGYKLGEYACTKLMEEVHNAGANMVWKIEFEHSIGVDYCFVETCLAPVLSDYGTNLPENTVLVVVCRNSSDRENLLRGLGWQRGDPGLHSEEQTLALIAQRKRFCVRVKAPCEEKQSELDYVATTEPPLLAVVRFIESVGEATVDDIRQGLMWDTDAAFPPLKELERRRQIFRRPVESRKTGEEKHYLSIARVLGGAERKL